MSMSNGARKGVWKSLPFNLGIWTGFTIVMNLCAAFCSMLAALIPKIRLPMMILGAGYMLYLAWKTLRSTGEIQEKGIREGYLPGLLLQFVNAKEYIYGIVSMEAYILPHYQGQPVTLALFALLLAAIGFVFTLCWSAFGSVFRRLFSRRARVVNTVMALLLVYCSVSLFLT
jgi:threonine/homoserine/homoserine lactone efflux protein